MIKNGKVRLFSGSVLKWLAILLMLVDHVGASLLEVFVLNGYGNSPLAGLVQNQSFWWSVDRILRHVGRSAFPLFCFLLVEGAVHTRDIRRYLLRLSLFAVCSEIPFDLALRNQVPWWDHQNVYFTLALGVLVILVFQKNAGREWRGILALGMAALAAEILKTDYGATGVLTIGILYLLRDNLPLASVLSLMVLTVGSRMELYAVPAYILMFFYNGKRGRQPKWFFYLFYPVHLFLLWLVGRYFLLYFL